MSEQTGSWQPDPFGRNQYRYWDGAQWTDQVSNNGVVTTDPAVAEVAAPQAPAEPPAAETPAPAAAEPAAPVAADPAGWAASTEPAPTQAVPAADPTTFSTPSYAAPSAPGSPGGPGSYPPPAASGGDGSGGGNKTPLIIAGAGVLALILGVGAYFLFFSGDDDGTSGIKAELIASMRSESGLSQDEAECVVNELDKSLDLNEVAGAIENDEEPTTAQMTAIMAAFGECEVDIFAMGDDDPDDAEDDDGTTTTSEPEDDDDDNGSSSSGGVTMPPAMISAIASEMAGEMGISQDEAECFVEGLFENMNDGQFEAMLSDPDNMNFEGMEWAIQLFSDCGIDPNAIANSGSSGGFQSGSGGSYGDDAALDALWDACEGGSGAACDDLYTESPAGSEYEQFGDTCGGRVEAGTVWCSEAIG